MLKFPNTKRKRYIENNNIHAREIISVNCTKNGPVDIKAGGPECLGFDFYVKYEATRHYNDHTQSLK